MAEEVDALVLVGHGEGVVDAADAGDGAVLAVEVGGGAGDGDDEVHAAIARSPEPIGVVTADDGREAKVAA